MHRASDVERHSHGVRFRYRGHDCEITYDGIKPHFTVDGRNAENVLDGFSVDPETVGRGDRSWRDALMRAIDAHEGDDTEADDYHPPSTRRAMRLFTRSFYRETVPDVFDTYNTAHRTVRDDERGWHDLLNRQRELAVEMHAAGDEPGELLDAAMVEAAREVLADGD